MIDITGQKFGRLVAIKATEGRSKKGVLWLCQCDCGNTKLVASTHLRCGSVRSCGCLKEELRGKNFKKHGGSRTRLYRIWKQIHTRCNNPNSINYKDYGGRGINLCEEWKNDFSSFLDWSTSNGYAENLTIDRIDNDGNYCPENCRWVTNKKQQNNKRSTVFIEYDGQKHSLSEWAEIIGVTRNALWKRLFVEGWSIERALTTPLTVRNKKK